jgi:hypothetical protein
MLRRRNFAVNQVYMNIMGSFVFSDSLFEMETVDYVMETQGFVYFDGHSVYSFLFTFESAVSSHAPYKGTWSIETLQFSSGSAVWQWTLL